MDFEDIPKCPERYRILELEKLNTETATINKLELELEEANTTFRMLLNEATRRLKGLTQRLGNSVERARPYHEALTAAQEARAACQRAAVAYQRASEIHAAAKETVALAEQRFKSNQHEWQFDNAWQEMLNHATIKVMDAENQKSESGREHHKRAQLFNAAEAKLQQLEDQLKKYVVKSRPYFDEKQLCQEQLATQKERIDYLQNLISEAKFRYSQSLKTLEAISEEIHMKRKDMYDDGVGEYPVGPREPGVGAENYPDYSLELEMNDLGLRKFSTDTDINDETGTLEELRRHVRRLAARPVEGGERGDSAWETELNETVNRLDQMLMMRERAQQAKSRDQSRHSPKAFNYAQDLGSSSSFDNRLQSQPQSYESTILNTDLIVEQKDHVEVIKSNTPHELYSYTPFEGSLPTETDESFVTCMDNTTEKSDMIEDQIKSEVTSNSSLTAVPDYTEPSASLTKENDSVPISDDVQLPVSSENKETEESAISQNDFVDGKNDLESLSQNDSVEDKLDSLSLPQNDFVEENHDLESFTKNDVVEDKLDSESSLHNDFVEDKLDSESLPQNDFAKEKDDSDNENLSILEKFDKISIQKVDNSYKPVYKPVSYKITFDEGIPLDNEEKNSNVDSEEVVNENKNNKQELLVLNTPSEKESSTSVSSASELVEVSSSSSGENENSLVNNSNLNKQVILDSSNDNINQIANFYYHV